LILNVNDGELTANLRAPVVVNIRKRLAFQMILDDMEIPIQHPIRPEEKPSDSP
jgi:flagellar assembly factor FliW